MKFIDEVEIEVMSGKGGDGCVSFRREKFIPKGGPNGGDGGRGGSVILQSDRQLVTLMDQRYTRHYHAKNGEPGRGSDCFGHGADDLVVRVPVGTQVFDLANDELLADLDQHGAEVICAKGGDGGRGNLSFKSSTNQAPRKAEMGELGETKRLLLTLKLLADVGVVGFPNTGKSTLVSRVSKAKPKIADYPFTTLVPTLGVVALDREESFVIADVPGLIEGAHTGAGLGHRFLKHVERCKVLVHLITWFPEDPPTADSLLARFDVLEREMELFDPALSAKPRVVAISKIDLAEVRSLIGAVSQRLESRGISTVAISAATGEGLEQLINTLRAILKKPVQ